MRLNKAGGQYILTPYTDKELKDLERLSGNHITIQAQPSATVSRPSARNRPKAGKG